MTIQPPSLFQKVGVTTAEHHLFLCIGPECCEPEIGSQLWDHVKSRLKQVNAPVMRTKALCFRVCSGGPWLLIYPEGVWYGSVSPERFDQILEQHILGGTPIADWISITHPLKSVCHLTTPTETSDGSPSSKDQNRLAKPVTPPRSQS